MKKQLHSLFQFISVIVIVSTLVGCGGSSTLLRTGPSAAELAAVDYTPVSLDTWPVSTPEEQGLASELVAELYYNASQLKTIYSLLVFKNGYLVAEEYFHIGSPELQVNIHSVTKSITSALVGIALEEGCLTSLDQKMMDFFPELQDQITDPRKNEITIRQMLGIPGRKLQRKGPICYFPAFTHPIWSMCPWPTIRAATLHTAT